MSISEASFVKPMVVDRVDDQCDINVGSMGEQAGWAVLFNYDSHETPDGIASGDAAPCSHATNVRLEPRYTAQQMDRMPKGSTNWHEVRWTVPRVVHCRTQGGYDCTLVCLDCILEAAAKLPQVAK